MSHTSCTEGRKLLAALLGPNLTAYRVALSIGVRPDSVYRWLNGTSRPEAPYRDALQRIFKLPASAWYTDAERVVAYGRNTGGLARQRRTREVVRDEDVPEYDPAVDEPSPEEVAS